MASFKVILWAVFIYAVVRGTMSDGVAGGLVDAVVWGILLTVVYSIVAGVVNLLRRAKHPVATGSILPDGDGS